MKLARREFLELVAAAALPSVQAKQPVPAAQPPARPDSGATAARRGDPWLEVSGASLVWNLRAIQERVGGKPVMAVVKANAYGHGFQAAQILESAGVNHFLVGKLDEAQQMRAAGVRGRILNFGPYSERDADEIIRLGISQNVYTEQVDALDRTARRLGQRARVHVKVDTGLGRFGVPHDRALDFLERVAALRGVLLEGVFTTLTEDPEFDLVQLARFREICARATAGGRSIGLRHVASSAAILDLPAAYTDFDMVRPGIMLYGLYPSTRAEQEKKIELRPALSLKCRVAYVKTLRAGESVSYHRAFVATQPEPVATLPVGYSDGFPRTLAGKGAVLVGGQRCPIVAISANATIVRLGEARTAVGDEAVLIGTQGGETISSSEVAALTGQSVYGVVIGMSGLLPQRYV